MEMGMLIAHLGYILESGSSPKRSKGSLVLAGNHGGEVTNLPERGQEAGNHRRIMRVKGTLLLELNSEPGLCSFGKLDKEPIDFGPVPGVKIVSVVLKNRRVGMSDDDFAEFGADK